MLTNTGRTLQGGVADLTAPIKANKPLGPVLEFMRSLWGVNHGLESMSRRMGAQLGVTGPERMVVRLVGWYPGISAGELARILRVHPSTLTGLLRRLVRRQIITRKAAADDARRAVLTLTQEGAAVDEIRSGTVEAVVRAALSELPGRDLVVAAAVLDALVRALGE